MSNNNNNYCCCCRCLVIAIWPIVSIVFGLITGLMLGISVTIWVFLLALIRTPASIAKMMYMTATTTTVFTHCYLDPPLRIMVFILAPVPRLLFVGGLTIYALTCGTCFYIGMLTGMMFKMEWELSALNDKSPIPIAFISAFQDEIDAFDDDNYNTAMWCLKGLCALIPGIVLGIFPFIPFSIMVLLITIYRLPINVYKTMKIALCTVVLKWDLKIAALFILPISHAVFTLVAFTTALVGSFFHFINITTKSIVESHSPFHKWGTFQDGLRKYHEAHRQFVGENQLGRYDHPTGIPSGWQGETYGIPIRKILRWHWDFLVCCFLLMMSLLICCAGSTVIFTLKLIPSIFKLWSDLCKELSSQGAEAILCWPCFLLAFLSIPLGALLHSLLMIVGCTLASFRVPTTYLAKGYLKGFRDPFEILDEADRNWGCIDVGRVLQCLPDERRADATSGGSSVENAHESAAERGVFVDAYWDRFASQCIQSASDLLSKKWISLEDVQSMEPSSIQAIPAIAMLEVLADSTIDPKAQNDDQDILWKIDDTLCKREDRPRIDSIATLLWPKVMRIKRLLARKVGGQKAYYAEPRNVQVLRAMICNNAEDVSSDLKAFLEGQKVDDGDDPSDSPANKEIRSKLIELTLILLRVKPFQERMTQIFGHEYDIETGVSVLQ